MIHDQKGFKDLFSLIKTEGGLALSFFILVVIGLFMPFVGFRITGPGKLIYDIYDNGFAALGSSTAWVIIAIAGVALAARHIWELFAYRDLIDSIALSALIFALIQGWVNNPISERLLELKDGATDLAYPVSGFFYPDVGMGCLVVAGICLLFSTRDRRRRYRL